MQVCAPVSHLSYFEILFAPSTTPATGFAPGVVTALPEQTEEKAYTAQDSLRLEIPRLGINAAVVSVPLANGIWDVSWLADQIGWLDGTAFPTLGGNSVLTAHVYDSNGLPGPFVNLDQMRVGDRIIVHAFDEAFVYEVRLIQQVKPDAIKSILKHEQTPWITLVTCRGYDEATDSYRYRVVVRAVQVEIR